MQKAIGWQLVLFVVVLLCGAMPSQAQEESKQNSDTAKANVERPAKAAHAYCVDLSIHELENGKKLNTRHYSMDLNSGPWSEIKIGTRVPVEGHDEVAALATSFNRAADRIEALVGAQRTLLASASHELRSPLARLRVALELMGADRPDLRERVARDVAELDELIAELLLASRLESVEQLDRREDVDLLGLVAEEAARSTAEVSGQPVVVKVDAKLLRRLVRNLLENAVRYGAPPVEATVDAPGGRARLRVCDRGPGVPDEERERIFAPFYRSSSRPPGEGGSGLGLALVRQIARRHGGEARCLAREGGGTCFEVDLPAFVPSGH